MCNFLSDTINSSRLILADLSIDNVGFADFPCEPNCMFLGSSGVSSPSRTSQRSAVCTAKSRDRPTSGIMDRNSPYLMHSMQPKDDDGGGANCYDRYSRTYCACQTVRQGCYVYHSIFCNLDHMPCTSVERSS